MTAILADSLSVEDAAQLLELHRSRLRQMLSDRSLYGIKTDGEWRIPAFQFVGRRLARNLGPVLKAAPKRLHPIELFNWLNRPEQALVIEGQAVPPLRWLELGGDVERVAAIAAEL
jgi:excisionase family DNA binding protein